jgi:hypothetical protein
MRSWLVTVSLLLCCDASEPNEARRMPKPPPPEQGSATQIGEVSVTVDGEPQASISGTTLDALPADYTSEDRRAWRFSTLLGAKALEPGRVIAVTGEKGLVLELPMPNQANAPEPVLVVSRRGDVMAAMVEPGEPFPAYHGRGGRLGRRGDPLPRIAGVTKLELLKR